MIKYDTTWITKYRQERGYSQAYCARLSGIKQQQWSRYESGKSKPSIDALVSIMQVLLVDDARDLERIFVITKDDCKGRLNLTMDDLND